MKDSIGLRGKWSSPGGNSKRFKSSNLDLVMTWYFKKQQTLLIQGKDGNSVKEKLVKLCQTASLSASKVNLTDKLLVK